MILVNKVSISNQNPTKHHLGQCEMFINLLVNNLQNSILVVLDMKHEQHPVQRTYLVPYKVL